MYKDAQSCTKMPKDAQKMLKRCSKDAQKMLKDAQKMLKRYSNKKIF